MDDLNHGGIRLATETDQFSVVPGGSTEIQLALINPGQTADQVRISAEGIPPIWISTEQPVLLLQPSEERRVVLTIQPPAPPNAHAGRYRVLLRATSTLDPARSAEVPVTITVAGYEVKGRVGVLLDGLQFAVVPGEQLATPIVLINQGIAPDTFHVAVRGLPEDWFTISTPALRLEAGEETSAMLVIQSPRQPASRAGRRPFQIQVTSLQAPDQEVMVDCILTVGAFIEFRSSLEAAQPDKEIPSRVQVENLSNTPISFQVTFNSPEDGLTFEPSEPQKISLPAGEKTELTYTVKPARKLWIGGEKGLPYTAAVQASDHQTQTLEGTFIQKALLPVWAAAVGGGVLLLCCLCLILAVFLRGQMTGQPTAAPPVLTTTASPALTATLPAPLPTATQSQTDQRPLLVGRNWYLVAFNDTRSLPGVQEAYTLFNPDGTLIGYTGCKDLSGSYQTSFNQITISNINLSRGTCPDSTLQQQEDAMVAILRAARSYFVADTTLQIAGDAGFLNYSLTPVNRPEEIIPPQAVFQLPPQAQTGQTVVFDGSASTGQVPLVSWRWEFGDGRAASGVIVQHTYRDPGAYNVQLTVTDQRGQTGASAQQILILPPPTPTAAPTQPPLPTVPPEQPTPTSQPPTPEFNPPQARINGPGTGYLGEPVVFDASASTQGSSPIVSFGWSFGDGSNQPASPQPSVSTIYSRTGDYEVTVTVVDANGLSSNATTRITIDARLDTQVWTLSALNGQPLIPGTAITLQFLQGELAGFAGCNTYNGRFTSTDNGDSTYSVAIESLSTSRRSCPVDIMTQESNYLAAFDQVTSAAIRENMLTLTYPAGTLVFYLVNAP